MPCGLRGHCETSCDPSPNELTTLPCGSNSTTVGAAWQHSPNGGFCTSPSSSSVRVSGRCVTQTCCRESTYTPVMDPKIQLFGSSRGHDGSTRNCGAVLDCAVIG